MLDHSLRIGLCFGLTSATITTLGLMVGLNAGTGSPLAVMGGILTIAIADAFSDALGIHVSEESESKHSTREIWVSTIATFCSKFFFALTFLVPVALFDLSTAVVVSTMWGVAVICVLSFVLARQQGKKPWTVIVEHVLIIAVVIVLTHQAGHWIARISTAR